MAGADATLDSEFLPLMLSVVPKAEEIPAIVQAQWTQPGHGARPSQADLATQRSQAGSILSPGEGDRSPLPTAMCERQGTKRTPAE
ncbi:unnamed protein product [Boreogadus saida]